MSKERAYLDLRTEDLLARLTTAAYSVALNHGIAGAFIDVQLEIWSALRDILQGEQLGRSKLLPDKA